MRLKVFLWSLLVQRPKIDNRKKIRPTFKLTNMEILALIGWFNLAKVEFLRRDLIKTYDHSWPRPRCNCGEATLCHQNGIPEHNFF
jgi:hypothetical protein